MLQIRAVRRTGQQRKNIVVTGGRRQGSPWPANVPKGQGEEEVFSPPVIHVFQDSAINFFNSWQRVRISVHVRSAKLVTRRIHRTLTLRLLMSYIYIYIYGAPSKARNATVVYIRTYVWQRWNSLFLFAAQCFNTESMQRGFLCPICV